MLYFSQDAPVPFLGRKAPAQTMPTPDEQLDLDELQRLDSRVVGAVFDRHFSEIYRYVFHRVGDSKLAEDIASDVFVRLLESARRGRAPRSNLKGWLISTASHAVADQFRKKYRAREEELSDSLPDPGLDPTSEAAQRERNRAVQSAYVKLTAEQQHVLALRFGQGYSLEETADLMAKNVNAVKALQFRALAALQREIGEVSDE
jgi:RNA polymerase sigma-70 factor (ECF subfamily)